ncbi:MAG: glycosyltransferase family 4 protein [Acidiferrobacterales bacterium]
MLGMSLILAVLAFGVSAWLTRRLSNPESRLYMLDHPNPRSLHDSPTPRGGGLAVLVAVFGFGALALMTHTANTDLLWMVLGAFLVAVVSFLDDWLTLNLGYRIVIHFAVASLLVWGGFTLESIMVPGAAWVLPAPALIALSLLFIVWMVNLYNFMDGMDGFAAGMAVIGFGSFAILGWLDSQPLFATLNLIVAAGAGGFLLSNFPPARIFMGDVGSSLLGFLAAAFMLWADRDRIFPLWLGVIVFSPFILDATITLIKRILRGEKFWEAHKTHYYQRLVQLGWGHRRTVLWEYGLMLLCALSALLARFVDPATQWGIIGVWLLVCFFVALAVHRLETRYNTVLTR